MDELVIKLHVEKLPEGVYLATSDDLPGLVSQGRTFDETIEIARDVARKILESQREHGEVPPESIRPFTGSIDVLTPIAV
jgi:predicted RNase H-like HicB family nuclease